MFSLNTKPKLDHLLTITHHPHTWAHIHHMFTKPQSLSGNLEFQLLNNWGFDNFLQMKDLKVLIGNMLHARPTHVPNTSSTHEPIKNTSKTLAQRSSRNSPK
jgi:hypothetical protein